MSRVLFVTNDFPPRRGGIESFVLALCQRFDPAEVVVYTASMPGWRAYDRRLAFPVYRDPASTLLPLPSVARRVVEVMDRHGCDRVVFGASAPLGLLGAAAWIGGNGALLNCCVERLERDDPGYTLGRLLSDLSDRALPPSLWDELGGDLRRDVGAVTGLQGLH